MTAAYPPQLDGLVIGGQQHSAAARVSAPFDLVDLFLYLQRLEIIEFRLMRLEFCQVTVLKSTEP